MQWAGGGGGAGVLWVGGEVEGFTKSSGTLSAEQNGGHAQSGCVGHEGEAVLRRHRDQGVGRGLLRPSEAVPRRPAQVSHLPFSFPPSPPLFSLFSSSFHPFFLFPLLFVMFFPSFLFLFCSISSLSFLFLTLLSPSPLCIGVLSVPVHEQVWLCYSWRCTASLLSHSGHSSG